MNIFERTSSSSAGLFSWVLAALVWIGLAMPSFAQLDASPFIEENGLIVMEAESVPRNNNWQFESSEPGFAGEGYLRYVGANHFNDPGFDILEFQIVITNPGTYRLFNFISHLNAPEPDQQNDVWTKMDDGEWLKTVHGGLYVDLGFTYHTTWALRDEQGQEFFMSPEYELDAGVHTFFISGRSWNVRLDRIHIWKDDAPFKVSFNTATDNTLPESERDNTILTVNPSPIAFATTPVGGASTMSVDLVNNGDEPITVTGVSLSGADAAQFSHNFSGSIQVSPNSTAPLSLTFEPTSVGSKTASISVTHNGLNNPLVANLFGSASSGGIGSTVLFRVNAGGVQIDDPLRNWDEDQATNASNAVADAEPGNPHPNVNALGIGDWTWGKTDPITLSPSVPPGVPVELFQTGRWDPSSTPQMQWDIPVEAGKEVEVRLYFTEIRFQTAEDPEGPRVFTVTIDGITYGGFGDLNIYDEVGHDVGIMRSAVVVSDGNLDIDFLNGSNDPIVMGIEVIELGGLSRMLNEGWNLVGLPTAPSDNYFTSVFDNVSILGTPFFYADGLYQTKTNLEVGEGYWIELDAAGSQSFGGDIAQSVTLNLEAGWNMISGPGCVVQYDAIQDPGNILIDQTLFSFDSFYQNSSLLLPGVGYWIQASGAGSITMNCSILSKAGANAESSVDLSRFGVIEVRDAFDSKQTLYFGSELDEGTSLTRFLMPPQAPSGYFDVRFNSGSWLHEGDNGIVLLQSDAPPLTITLEREPVVVTAPVILEKIVNGVYEGSATLHEGQSIVIEDNRVEGFRILAGDDKPSGLPSQFVLTGNYPNPFNPSTQIQFDLPENASVKVELFDLIGRNVLSLPERDIAAGVGRHIQVDGSTLASGTYLYQVRAVMAGKTSVQMGRMTLIK